MKIVARKTNLLVVFICLLVLVSMLFVGCAPEEEPVEEVEPEEEIEYPTQSIQLVVGYAPGGSLDLEARAWAPRLQEKLGVDVTVNNIEGAGGRIATTDVYNADPDGYTIYLDNFNPSIIGEVVFDEDYSMEEFEYLGYGSVGIWVLASSADVEYEDFGDFIDTAEEEGLRIGHPGRGTLLHLIVEMIGDKAGVDIIDVPFEGGPASVAGLLAQECDVIITTELTAYRNTEDLNVFATISPEDERSFLFPDVPTNVEQGYDLEGLSPARRHFLAPPGTPEEVVQKLRDALSEIASDDEFIEKMKEDNIIITPMTEQDYYNSIEGMPKLLEEYQDLFN